MTLRTRSATPLWVALLLAPSLALADHKDVFGNWSSFTLTGDFQSVSPNLKNFKWLLLNQGRFRDDNPDGLRFSENLLFAQVGYALNENASVWLGYTRDWIEPVGGATVDENRAYQDFLWKQPLGAFTLTSRTRLEQRVRESDGNVGVRGRQLIQFNYALPFAPKVSLYVGDESMAYTATNYFGPAGFTENRALGGISTQLTPTLGFDAGYLGQYIVSSSAHADTFTHNLQFNLSYKF